MAEYVFTLRNVRKAHGDKVVLDNVTLSFLHGAKIGVVGPNGTGKSTLLKIMAGLEHANNGDAILDPGATVGHAPAGAAADRGQDGARERRGGRRTRSRASSTATTRSPRSSPTPTPTTTRCSPRWATCRPTSTTPTRGTSTAGSTRRWTRCAARRRTSSSTTSPVVSVAGSRCASCCSSSRPAAARRAHQPPRRRVGAVARGPPGVVPRRRPGRDPRPVLPRQRRQLDPRARPWQGPPLRGQLLDLPRDQEGPPQDRGPEGRQAGQDARARARVGAVQRQGPPDQEQVASGALRGDGGRGRPDAQDRHLRDQHPGRPAARRHRPRGARPRPRASTTAS